MKDLELALIPDLVRELHARRRCSIFVAPRCLTADGSGTKWIDVMYDKEHMSKEFAIIFLQNAIKTLEEEPPDAS